MFKVRNQRCKECLFSKNKIVSNARRAEVLSDCEKKDKHFICHLHRDVCCRGFFDTQKSQSVQVAKRLEQMGHKVINWVEGEGA